MKLVIVIVLFLMLEALELSALARYVDHIKLKDGRKLYWGRLTPGARYLGGKNDHHDSPIYCFGFWFFHVYVGTF